MADENWQKVREIFDVAVDKEPQVRQDYIFKACGGDKNLLAEVESFFSTFDKLDGFMEKPAVEGFAEVIEVETKKLKRGQCFNHYEIIEQIGKGGMGEVYLSVDKKLDRKVAIKILNEKFSQHESNIIRFVREAKAASALNHPNILVIHEIGESDGAHYIASEYVEGKTLREALRKSSLKLSEILDISIQIAGALAAAHKAHLVHRDIKPENIMIRPDGFIKVLDFGLAKLVERKNQSIFGLNESTLQQNDTAKGIILGTVNYMSPEQAKGERVDERADIFSLGALVYEMITGRTPFAGDSVSETFANLIKIEPPPLSRFAANMPDELQRIVSKMLKKDKDERYQTMKDVFGDLKTIRPLDGQLDRFTAQGDQATEILQATTGDAKQLTAETQKSFSQQIKQHKPFAAFVLIALLAGVVSLGYYLLMTGKPISDKKSIAVLPLKPINTGVRDELYEIGIAESIIHRLSATKSFYIRPLSATRQYTDVTQDPVAAGREQKTDYVLASNYQLAYGKIRLTAQLFNVATGQIEETYKSEKDAGSIFSVQDAIANEVGNLLFARFAAVLNKTTAKRGTVNEEAYRLYLQGRNLTMKRSQADAQKAVEYFEQAIRLDPNYALAFVGMAHAYSASGTLAGGSRLQREVYEKARAALNKAVEIDANLADVYAVHGDLKIIYEWDFAGAEKDLTTAIELEPSNDLAHAYYALWLNHHGRFEEAFAEIEIALEIDPNSLVHQRDRGRFLYFARRYDEAIAHLERVLEVDENFGTAFHWLILAYEKKGDYARAFEWIIKEQKQLNPENVEMLEKAYEIGGWEEARRKLLEFEKVNEQTASNYYRIAREHALLNEKQQAFEYLNKALENRQAQMTMLKVEPAFDSLRDDPRFDELLRRVGFK